MDDRGLFVQRLRPEEVGQALTVAAPSLTGPLDLQAEANNPACRIWLAAETQSGKPIAFLVVWLVGDEIEIVNIRTQLEARRRGAARALLHALIDFAKVTRGRALWLEVRAGNEAALGLYGCLGFEVVRRRPRYYDDSEDALVMTLAL
jgi:ribosomal protein S18 acetylase RimI-like enzyme